jgi:hypothetical protein
MRAKKEQVYIVKSVQNHSSFYDSIHFSEIRGGADVTVMDEAYPATAGEPPRGAFRRIVAITCGASRITRRIYLEEFALNSTKRQIVMALLLMIFKKARLSLCIHNLNSWLTLGYPATADRTIRFFIRCMLLRTVSEVILVSDSLRTYAENMCDFKIRFRVVPFRLNSGTSRSIDRSSPSMLVIPGNVEESRRCYLTVVEACYRLAKNGENFKLVFLGKFNEKNLSAKLNSAIDGFIREFPGRLIIFRSHVDENEFEKYVLSCACLIGNLVPYYRTGAGATEMYGLTKETGIRILADFYDKKCVVPEEIPAGKNSANYIKYRGVEELCEVLGRLI